MSNLKPAYKFQKYFIPILVILITLLFGWMIWNYIVAILLAAIFSGLLYPIYTWILKRANGYHSMASGITIATLFLVIVLPLLGLISLVINEAVGISEGVVPIVQKEIENSSNGNHQLPDWLPFAERLEPYKTQILEKINKLASYVGSLLLNSLSSLTQGTLIFFLNLFLMLYAMFFFFIHGKMFLDEIEDYLPLSEIHFQRMLQKGLSITRATLKGALLMGILQGSLMGIAFWVLGIQGAVFWGTVSIVMSVIPTVGCGIIWIPIVIYFILIGDIPSAIGLTLWGAGFVASIDNVLRPSLIGKDTKMHDLMIFLSTIGGLSIFGAVGFIIGPIVAGLFLTIWDIYRLSLLESTT